jgi:hypothetical protein
MKKIILLSFLFISIPGISKSQVLDSTAKSVADTAKIWKIVGKSALNFSQVSLSNWSEGGIGSMAGTFIFGINANNKQNRHIWDNSFSFEFGMTKNNNESARKSIDQIYLSSKYGYLLHGPWFLSALLDFRTQSAKGYNYPNNVNYISRFMAPGYLNFALGFDYKPKTNVSLMLSPISAKMTFVMDDSLSNIGAFGVDPGNKYRAELGGYVKFAYIQKSLLKNVDLETRLDLFSNYFHHPQNVDINWDIKFDMKINKFMQASFGTTLKYDDDIKYVDSARIVHGPRTQVKQFLGIGILFIF